MFSTRTRASRAVAATLALAGAAGLSACQDSGPTAAPPTSSAAAPSTPSTTTQSPTSTQSPTQPSTTEAPSSTTQAPTPPPNVGDTTPAPKGTKLKYGQPAVLSESFDNRPSADAYKVQVDSLDIAPDSIFASNPSLSRANGSVYFLRYQVTNIGKSTGSSFDASDVNSFMLKPKIPAGQTGRKILGSIPGCDTESTPLAVGQTGKGCDVYQFGGAPISEVVWAPGTSITVTWTK